MLRAVLNILVRIQNPFLTAQSTQIKSVISVPIKDFIHHYPRACLTTYPGSVRTFTTYPGRDVLLRHTRVGAQFNDIPGSLLVRNASPRGPMCFRCLIFNLSGPCELLFLLCFIASWT